MLKPDTIEHPFLREKTTPTIQNLRPRWAPIQMCWLHKLSYGIHTCPSYDLLVLVTQPTDLQKCIDAVSF